MKTDIVPLPQGLVEGRAHARYIKASTPDNLGYTSSLYKVTFPLDLGHVAITRDPL